MKTFYINPATGDMEFDGQKRLKMVSEDDEIIQGVWLILSTNIDEWELNPDLGFARFKILGQVYDEETAIDELNAAILQHDRIASVENVTLDYDRPARKLSVTFTAVKTNGETIEGVANV